MAHRVAAEKILVMMRTMTMMMMMTKTCVRNPDMKVVLQIVVMSDSCVFPFVSFWHPLSIVFNVKYCVCGCYEKFLFETKKKLVDMGQINKIKKKRLEN